MNFNNQYMNKIKIHIYGYLHRTIKNHIKKF